MKILDAYTDLQLREMWEFWGKNIYIFLIFSCFILQKIQLGDFGLNSGFWEQQVVLAYCGHKPGRLIVPWLLLPKKLSIETFNLEYTICLQQYANKKNPVNVLLNYFCKVDSSKLLFWLIFCLLWAWLMDVKSDYIALSVLMVSLLCESVYS